MSKIKSLARAPRDIAQDCLEGVNYSSCGNYGSFFTCGLCLRSRAWRVRLGTLPKIVSRGLIIVPVGTAGPFLLGDNPFKDAGTYGLCLGSRAWRARLAFRGLSWS